MYGFPHAFPDIVFEFHYAHRKAGGLSEGPLHERQLESFPECG